MLIAREIDSKDIELVLDYWYSRSQSQLKEMGADLNRMPSRFEFKKKLDLQIHTDYQLKKEFTCIWLKKGEAIGHNNITNISFGNHAFMHLHIWDIKNRRSGLGLQLLQKSIPIFFKKFDLQTLYCEPFSKNPAPNNTLKKLGFTFEKKYITIPGIINFEQEVNRWNLTKYNYALKKWI